MLVNRVRVDYIDTGGGADYEIFEIQPGLLDRVEVEPDAANDCLCVWIYMHGDANPQSETIDLAVKLVSVTAYNAGPTMLRIVRQPVDARGAIGATFTFHVDAAGEGELSYVWQYRTQDSGSNWTKSGLTGNTTDTATSTISVERLRYEYRCQITDATGAVIYTNAVKLIREG